MLSFSQFLRDYTFRKGLETFFNQLEFCGRVLRGNMQRVILRGSLRKYLLTNISKGKLCPQISATYHQSIVHLRLSSSSSNALNILLPSHDEFCMRHIGPRESDQADMLKFLGYEVRFFFCLFQNIKFYSYF